MLIQHTIVISIFLSSILSFCCFDRKEYFILAIFSVIGMLVLVSSFNMITIFVAMELLTLPLYGMIAINNKYEHALEAAIKFFIVSVFSSGVFLFGLSLLYGATHSLLINEMIRDTIHFNSLEMAGLLFILIGISFKLGVIPFHAWVPDVYSSVSPRAIAFVGGAPKIAALVLYLHIAIAFIPTLAMQWILIVLAIASMIIGNLAAITQKNIKRMLGYSAIAQAGFSLLGIISGTRQGYEAAIFYITMYSFMFIAAFSIIALSQKLENLKDRQPFVFFYYVNNRDGYGGVSSNCWFFGKNNNFKISC